jgi:hypothetical protein
MCKPISFVSDGKGNFKFFSFPLRKKAASSKGLRRKGDHNAFPVDKCDSHSSISEYFKMPEDQSNKYEYDFVRDVIVVDQLNAQTEDYESALSAFAQKELRPLVKRLVAEGSDAMLWKVLPHVLSVNAARRLAIFSAEAVLPLFEAKYPKDNRPRAAVEAAKRVLEADTAENRNAAAHAANAAYSAANAAHAADAADAAAADAAARKIERQKQISDVIEILESVR